jgi:hypothetical protein
MKAAVNNIVKNNLLKNSYGGKPFHIFYVII